MLKLILNQDNSKAIEITSFNRSTSFTDNQMSSTAYCNIMNDTNAAANLQSIGLTPITHLQINKDNEPIYTLQDIYARISSLNEYLDESQINISIQFNFETNTEVEE